jgi:hypothetical protein
MRFSFRMVAFVSLGVMIGFFPLALESQSLGVFQSTADRQNYEIRERGNTGLDIYNQNGRIVASLDKKKPTDAHFKGHTEVLATNCPSNSGKIEVLDVTPDRIRARVELPSGNQRVCNMFFLNRWENFDLIKQSNPAPATASVASTSGGVPVPSVPAPSTSNLVTRNGFQYELQSCQREDRRIVCHLSVINTTGNDDHLTSGIVGYNNAAFYIDQFGNRVIVSLSQVGNVPVGQNPLVIPNLKMPMRLVFENTNQQATQLARLTLPVQNHAGLAQIEFSNVPITNSDQSPGGQPFSVTRDGVTYTLKNCERANPNLVCTLDLTNSSTDRQIAWYPNQTYVIDQLGNQLLASQMMLANKPVQGNVVIPASAHEVLTVTFAGISTNAKEAVRFELGGNDGAPVTVQYQKVPISN